MWQNDCFCDKITELYILFNPFSYSMYKIKQESPVGRMKCRIIFAWTSQPHSQLTIYHWNLFIEKDNSWSRVWPYLAQLVSNWCQNTPRTRGGPGGRDRTLDAKQLHISSSYAKILGKTNFSLGSFPKVFQKQKTEKKKIDNNGQLRIANATSGGSCKAAWAKIPWILLQFDF